MSLEPDATKSDALQQARAKARRLAGAFETVFGKGTRRTAEQKLVLEHLSACASDDQNAYRFNESRDGVSLIAAGIHRDGARSVLRIIDRQLAIAANVKVAKKEKPVTKR